MKTLCPKCGKNNFLRVFAHVFSRSPRPESRQWQCPECRSTLRLTVDSALKIWMASIAGVLILSLSFKNFSAVIARISVRLYMVWFAAVALMLLVFCLATVLLSEIEVIS